MFFASDNSGPVHPRIMEALVRANTGYAMPYGEETLMEQVRARVRDVFEAPKAAVYLVATGTAANSLILATLGKPWQTTFCTPVAHIHQDECNAPEFFSGGAKLTLVGGSGNGCMQPDALQAAIASEENRGVHGPQRGPLSITQMTERGTIYPLDQIAALTEIARFHNLPVHMDGARFTNALVALGCTPAEMTWKAGIDAVSLGGTKNGLLGVEAVIFFNPEHAWEFELRRKRGAHLFSKHRYLAAQMSAYLQDDLWLELARSANRAAARMVHGLKSVPKVTFDHAPEANMLFPRFSRRLHQHLHEKGAIYHLWDGTLDGGEPAENLTGRLVCDWSVKDADIDRFIKAAKT